MGRDARVLAADAAVRRTVTALALSIALPGMALCSLDACGASHPDGADRASSDGGAMTSDGGATPGLLPGFVPICNADGTPVHFLSSFMPEDPPDYWAWRIEMDDESMAGDGGDGGWSAMNAEENGTPCKTATDQAKCLATLAAFRQLAMCPTPLSEGGPPPQCSTEYIVATRGDRVLGLEYIAGFMDSNFTTMFGHVVIWQEAAAIMFGRDVEGRICSAPYPPAYRPVPGGGGFDVLLPTYAYDVPNGYIIWRVDPNGNLSQQGDAVMFPDVHTDGGGATMDGGARATPFDAGSCVVVAKGACAGAGSQDRVFQCPGSLADCSVCPSNFQERPCSITGSTVRCLPDLKCLG